MFTLGRCARAALLVIAVSPLVAAVNRCHCITSTGPRATAVILLRWKPSRQAARALKQAVANGDGARQELLRIMKNDHASSQSRSFAASFSHEAAYVSALQEDSDEIASDGFTVVKVTYPFRKTAATTYLILNGHPGTIDVSDPEYLRHINVASLKSFKAHWGSSMRAECVWSEPHEWYGSGDETEVEVEYPIKNLGNGKTIGTAVVHYRFSFPGRKFLGTKLEFFTDESEDKYFSPE